MAVETARKRGRPKKTDAEVVEGKKTVAKKDDAKSTEKRARKKKCAVEEQVPVIKSTSKKSSQERPMELNTTGKSSELAAPGPMTARILEEIKQAKDAAEEKIFEVAEKEHISANTSASSPPSKSFPSISMPIFPQSTARHQLAAMSTKSKPPASSPKPSSKASPPPKSAAKSSKSPSTLKSTAASSSSSSPSTSEPPTAKTSPKAHSASKSLPPKTGHLPVPPKEPSQPRTTPKQLNAMAVDPFTNPVRASGAGSAPQVYPPGKLPDKYKPTARRITAIIVSLPIFLVTSWVLYERLVLGKELKQLPRIPKDMPDYLPKWLQGRNRGGGDESGESPIAAPPADGDASSAGKE